MRLHSHDASFLSTPQASRVCLQHVISDGPDPAAAKYRKANRTRWEKHARADDERTISDP